MQKKTSDKTSQEPSEPHSQSAPLTISFPEFVGIIASLIALTAISIDVMLPSLPEIGKSFSLTNPNQPQVILTSYLGGFAGGQLLWGPLSDRYGRKPLLLLGLGIFIAATLAAIVAPTFATLLLARALQGFGAGAPRVLSLAIVRDRFGGRAMARVMSFVMSVFIIVPILAPALGQTLMQMGNWRTSFYVLLAAGVFAALWSWLRLSETHDPNSPGGSLRISFAESIGRVLHTPRSVGYAVATGFMFGCLMAYISSAQQIFVDVYKLGNAFPAAFGAIACAMAASTLLNARLVTRMGMRRLSHSALVGFVGISAALVVLAAWAQPPLWVFSAMLAGCFFMFGLIAANFNAIAMEPLAEVAGTASSMIGFYTSAASATLGWAIGAQFDGTVFPLAAGFFSNSLLALLIVIAVEGPARMFGRETH
jgi:MFS transporter, DHA1 family, multidrug resistance protein